MTNNCITEFFEKQVEKCKEKVAAKSVNRDISYNELKRRAKIVAHFILTFNAKKIGKIGSNNRFPGLLNAGVALLLEHDIDSLVGIFGVLKAGGYYVSLDPNYPVERLSYILKDCNAGVLITNEKNHSLAQEIILQGGLQTQIEIINLDDIDFNLAVEDFNVENNPGNYAYIMYTSGSTGKPKGVIQTQENILHFMAGYGKCLDINPSDHILLLTSFSHTVSAIDIFCAMLNGCRLLLYDIKVDGNIRKLPRWIKEEGITIFHSVPTLYRFMLDDPDTNPEDLSKIRLVILGGEEVFRKDLYLYYKNFSQQCLFVNLFGSSELIIASSYNIDKKTEITKDIVPVGRPFEGVEILLLDETDERVGVFGIGEMVFRSNYLSPGYWNKQTKSNDVFVEKLPDSDVPVYRSGDLGRKLTDGNIEYLGREDFQVKIRGFRVELGEIEIALDDLEEIKKSIVTSFKNKNGEAHLVGYYTSEKGKKLEAGKLKMALSQKLPDYMIPSQYVFLDKLPITPNGKIDRKSLKEPVGEEEVDRVYEPPRNRIEEKLVDIWQEILGEQKIGIVDNFFQLGGHSLLAIALVNKIYKVFNIEISLGDFLENQTISKLGEIISNSEEEKSKIEEILSDIEENEQI